MHHTTVYLLQPDALLHFVHITSHQPSNQPLTLTITINIFTINMTTVSSWHNWTLMCSPSPPPHRHCTVQCSSIIDDCWMLTVHHSAVDMQVSGWLSLPSLLSPSPYSKPGDIKVKAAVNISWLRFTKISSHQQLRVFPHELTESNISLQRYDNSMEPVLWCNDI